MKDFRYQFLVFGKLSYNESKSYYCNSKCSPSSWKDAVSEPELFGHLSLLRRSFKLRMMRSFLKSSRWHILDCMLAKSHSSSKISSKRSLHILLLILRNCFALTTFEICTLPTFPLTPYAKYMRMTYGIGPKSIFWLVFQSIVLPCSAFMLNYLLHS